MTRTLAKARTRGRKDPKAALVALYPLALERRYTKDLDARVKALVRDVVAALKEADRKRTDALDVDDLQAVVALVERVGVAHETRFIASGPRDVTAMGTRLNQWQDRRSSEFLGSVMDLNPKRLKDFMTGRPLSSLVNTWAANNVRLIQKAEGAFLDEVQAAVVDGLVEGRSTEDIARTIEERGSVARSRARLIARDQVATLNHEITKQRQTSLGLEEYRWTTSLDERVRDEHSDRHGKVFRWDTPPDDGHPGQAINCRCVATPVVPKKLDLFP